MERINNNAYHGEPERKVAFIAEMRGHQDADRFLRGTYWNGWESRGCAVGCSVESITRLDTTVQINHNDHVGMADWLGIPTALAFLEDRLFEGVSIERSKTWPVEFAEAIPVGADLTMAAPRFLHWLLSDPDGPVQRNASEGRVRDAVNQVAALYGRWIETGVRPDESGFQAAAWSAAWSEYERMADKLLVLMAEAPVAAEVV